MGLYRVINMGVPVLIGVCQQASGGGSASSFSIISFKTTSISYGTNSLNQELSEYNIELEELDISIEKSRERYKKQYGAMESIVNSFKSTGEFLDNYMEAQNKD